MRRFLTALVLGWALAAAAGAQAVVVEGLDRARVIPPAGIVVADYSNAGYRMRVGPDGEVEIEVDATPLQSTWPFALPKTGTTDQPPAIERLARSLTAGSSTRFEAVSRTLGWVSRNLRYDADREAPQDAVAVLARRRGYCTGLARTTVALLAAVGIEAREVPGWVVDPGNGTNAGYHRWVEVYYPDRGWTFSDPLAWHHMVPATYLRLASERIDPTAIRGGLLLERDDLLTPVDTYPDAASGVQARRNDPRQRFGSLHVVVGDARPGVAVLDGGGVRRSARLRAGASTFLGLEVGTYLLRVSFTDGGEIARRVRLRARVRSAILLPPLKAGEGSTR
ncbi:MAG: transglutaminase-like domain-containing protein [Acidobacteriota bacterium]